MLNFPYALGTERLDDLRQVLGFISPDILIVQEMQSQEGVQLLRDSVLNVQEDQYEAVPFHDGPDTDNALFYRSDRIEYAWSDYIATPNRDIAEYKLRTDAGYELLLYSVHLKSSQGDTNELIRLQEVTVLRNHLDSLDAGVNIIVAGDFNLYASTEPAYEMLTAELSNIHGRLYDPLFQPGAWHENISYASLHTQSSRDSTLPDGGAGGGLDDRFDMILCSESMLEYSGLYLDPSTYVICGNDGDHFDRAVNDGVNSVVPLDVADALYYAADHLPVSVSVVSSYTGSIAEASLIIWPNPMHGEAHIEFPWHDHFVRAELRITDVTGRCIFSSDVYSPDGYILQNSDIAVGIYFVTAELHTIYDTYQYHAKLAVTK
jgi:endonuclease/exonuclease/phosphatase family metal-dependent hydrolase